jgi:hypothetical protein
LSAAGGDGGGNGNGYRSVHIGLWEVSHLERFAKVFELFNNDVLKWNPIFVVASEIDSRYLDVKITTRKESLSESNISAYQEGQ